MVSPAPVANRALPTPTSGDLLLQTAADFGRVQAAVVLRLQVDQEATGIQRGVAAASTPMNELTLTTSGSLQDRRRQAC